VIDTGSYTVFPTWWGFASSLDADALVGGDDVLVAATGITNGSLPRGVLYRAEGRSPSLWSCVPVRYRPLDPS